MKECNKNVKRICNSKYESVNSELKDWFDDKRNHGLPISGRILTKKAKALAIQKKQDNFKGSNSWLNRWKKSNNISNQRICGESGKVDISEVQNWISTVWKPLLDQYSPDNIYNCDETSSFFKNLNNKTLNEKGTPCKGGKVFKNRITLLLCTNMTGNDKLRPLVIGKSATPRCLKNRMNKLPVEYYNNKKAWMTKDIFEDWINKFDQKLIKEKRKILLAMDNFSGHKIRIKLKNIKIVFFPPICTSVVQPLDQGIIKNCKDKYKNVVTDFQIDFYDKENKEAKIDLDFAFEEIAKAWNSVEENTILNFWKKAGLLPADF